MLKPNSSLVDPETRYRELVAGFQLRGYRLTPQRVALLRLLAKSEGHPSASQLLARMSEHFPTTSPATVYKTLAVLKEMGQVLEIAFNDFDNRYDGKRPYPHPHLICACCHSVVDAEAEGLEEISRRVAEYYDQPTGYRILSHRVDLLGVCPACQEAGDDERIPASVVFGEDAD